MSVSRWTYRAEQINALLVDPAPTPWELASTRMSLKIRWFGLIVGYVLANMPGRDAGSPWLLNAVLTLALIYAVIDTYCTVRGRLFILWRFPLIIAALEGFFITLLCRFDTGLNSPFRHYYLLSILVCALRNSLTDTAATCLIHCTGYTLLYAAALDGRSGGALDLVLTIVVLVWVAWAASSLVALLRQASASLREANTELQAQQSQLEARIAEGTRELREAQARLLHQEKMAAFGLLAAGIAHEVGNPLTSISALVQLAERRSTDPIVNGKLQLVRGQLERIGGTLRELIAFSRPAARERVWCRPAELIQDALDIAKYYQRSHGITFSQRLTDPLPALHVYRDRIAQAVLNLVLNAIDAVGKMGQVEVSAERVGDEVMIAVTDNGPGIAPRHRARLFEPYFTTKPQGTGLGLFVTKQLIEEHGGRVEVESPLQESGGGTRFRLCLPITEHHHAFPSLRASAA